MGKHDFFEIFTGANIVKILLGSEIFIANFCLWINPVKGFTIKRISMSKQKKEVIQYYDQYLKRQIETGINLRHRTIFRFLKREGLRPNHNVLEIGCGIGSITGLISSYLTSGRIFGIDISPESIAYACQHYSRRKNMRFEAMDILNLKTEELFDFVVFPDVLEHIPVENHKQIFTLIRKLVKPASIVFIHIPAPHYQEYLEKNRPELLQIIDQNLDAATLIGNIEQAGFALMKFETYTQIVKEGEYQFLVFKVKQSLTEIHHLPYLKVAWKELMSKFY